jgi:hypothetical protein
MKKLFSLLFISAMMFALSETFVNAGTDLSVTCNPDTVCVLDSEDTPLFNELNIYPGYKITQSLSVNNISSNQDCVLYLDVVDKSSIVVPNLASRIFTLIKDNSNVYYGEMVNGEVSSDPIVSKSLQNLYDESALYINTIAPNSSLSLDWSALVDKQIDNSYQNTQTIFDFELNFTCDTEPIPTPTSTDQGGSDNDSGDSSNSSSDNSCTAEIPHSAPILVAQHTGSNQVRLDWWPVEPVTHYALIFTRVSDGASYGSTNIGNITQYIVNDLQLNETYRFQVFGINDCAPGERSNIEEVTIITGDTVSIDQRPIGDDGQVLGEEDVVIITPIPTEISEEVVSDNANNQDNNGTVAGVTDSCNIGSIYLPLILLIIQLISMLTIEYVYRAEGMSPKVWWLVAVLGLTNIIFYLLRQCHCMAEGSILGFLCKWFILVSIAIALMIRFGAYAFVEEIENSDKDN